MATFLEIKKRVNSLIGETNYGVKAQNSVIAGHILASIKDIVNTHPFQWNVKTADLTLSSGTASLPADYNQKWKLLDAKDSNDNDFVEIEIKDRKIYSSSDNVYWITYNTTSSVYTFNSLVQSGTVPIYYYFYPADLSADTDVCIVPDSELVAYLAASKLFLGNQSNLVLKQEYKAEADRRLKALIEADNSFYPIIREGSILDYNTLGG